MWFNLVDWPVNRVSLPPDNSCPEKPNLMFRGHAVRPSGDPLLALSEFNSVIARRTASFVSLVK